MGNETWITAAVHPWCSFPDRVLDALQSPAIHTLRYTTTSSRSCTSFRRPSSSSVLPLSSSSFSPFTLLHPPSSFRVRVLVLAPLLLLLFYTDGFGSRCENGNARGSHLWPSLCRGVCGLGARVGRAALCHAKAGGDAGRVEITAVAPEDEHADQAHETGGRGWGRGR